MYSHIRERVARSSASLTAAAIGCRKQRHILIRHKPGGGECGCGGGNFGNVGWWLERFDKHIPLVQSDLQFAQTHTKRGRRGRKERGSGVREESVRGMG